MQPHTCPGAKDRATGAPHPCATPCPSSRPDAAPTLKYWKIWRARVSRGTAPGAAGPGTSYTLRTRLDLGARLIWDHRPEGGRGGRGAGWGWRAGEEQHAVPSGRGTKGKGGTPSPARQRQTGRARAPREPCGGVGEAASPT